MGPTASGKSALAERLAGALDATLLNADAFQVYRGFDIGTAKPVDRSRYRLLDFKEPHEALAVGEWIGLALNELQRLVAEGRHAIVVGGTGLYIRALMEEYAELAPPADPELRVELRARLESEGLQALAAELMKRAPEMAARTDLKNPVRVVRALERLASRAEPMRFELPPFRKFKFALIPTVSEGDHSIRIRLGAMLQAGWRDEVRELMARGISLQAPAMRAIGYRALAETLGEPILRDAVVEGIYAEMRQYAKRQRTWLRTERALTVLDPSQPTSAYDAVIKGI